MIRKIYWDKGKDQSIIQSEIEKDYSRRKKFLYSWPSIESINVILSNNNEIVEFLLQVDEVIGNGIIFSNRNEREWAWKDIVLMRRYDWGEIRSSWDMTKENMRVEKLLFKGVDVMEAILMRKHRNYYQIEMDYRMSLESFYKGIGAD